MSEILAELTRVLYDAYPPQASDTLRHDTQMRFMALAVAEWLDSREEWRSVSTFELSAVAMARVITEARAEAWSEGHKAGRDYQGDGWNSDAHDPEQDNPYREEWKP